MARGRQSVSCSARPASGRQQGAVRKSFNKRMWSARFTFRQRRDRVTMDGPARALRGDAEKDRQKTVAAMRQALPSSRVEVAADALRQLRCGELLVPQDVPGSASALSGIDASKFATMNWVQLRGLANKTPGITRNKKNPTGKWIPKTCHELRKELLALKQASVRVLKRPALARGLAPA